MNDKNSETGKFWSWFRSDPAGAPGRRREYLFAVSAVVWALSYTLAGWLARHEEVISLPTMLAIGAAVLLGVVTIWTYMWFLRSADELQRRIQMDGLAFGFGAGVFFLVCYQLAEHVGAPPLRIDYAIVFMAFSWSAGQLFGVWRYK